jgi:hypothetical protein
MGGSFLLNHEKRAKKWEMKGRRLLRSCNSILLNQMAHLVNIH